MFSQACKNVDFVITECMHKLRCKMFCVALFSIHEDNILIKNKQTKPILPQPSSKTHLLLSSLVNQGENKS